MLGGRIHLWSRVSRYAIYWDLPTGSAEQFRLRPYPAHRRFENDQRCTLVDRMGVVGVDVACHIEGGISHDSSKSP